MELRSSRSRSKTPFSLTTFDKQTESDVSVQTTRTTRRTTRTNAQSTSQEYTVIKQPKKKISTKSALYKTSDYSSEEGDIELSSSTISENERNQLLEDAKRAANGNSEVSALNLYLKSERYWEKYPKTDWTYSNHSRDRVELAPGVIAMPNMSRRTIHSEDGNCHFSHAETNTDYVYTKYKLDGQERLSRKRLFNNNEDVKYVESRKWTSIFSKTISRVFSSILIITRLFWSMQTSCFAALHSFCSKAMLLDSWLLQKSERSYKQKALILLCLLPLLLLGGWWLFWQLGGLLSNLSNAAVLFNPFESTSTLKTEDAKHFNAVLTKEQLQAIADILKGDLGIQTELVVEKIVKNPNFLTVINENIKEKEESIEKLQEELERVKLELLRKQEEGFRRIDNNFNELKLIQEDNTVKIKTCCKSLVDLEEHIRKILVELLNNKEFLTNQEGFKNWLHALFVAKGVLEEKLDNVTNRFDDKFEGMFENNIKLVMDKVSDKLKLRMERVEGGSLDEEQIRRIVKHSLTIYDADKTGLVDYAMESMGGQVLTTRCTESFHAGKAVVSVLGIPLWYPVNSPRVVITPGINPGECWAFQNFPGFLVVKLAGRVKIEAVSYEHISQLLVPHGAVDSAPRQFEIYGLTSENDKTPTILGSFTYEIENKDALQFFAIEGGRVFDTIELRVISNHGNPNYSCLYRFRVHGQLVNDL